MATVTKHRRQKPFREVVDALKASASATPEARPVPGLDGEKLVHLDGRTYELKRDELSPSEARELAAEGALVVWDSCACGGGCGLEWFGADEVRKMVVAGEPKIRKKNHWEEIWEMRSSDRACVLLVSGDVQWGDLLG